MKQRFTQAALAKKLGCSRAYIGELIQKNKLEKMAINGKTPQVVEIEGGKFIELVNPTKDYFENLHKKQAIESRGKLAKTIELQAYKELAAQFKQYLENQGQQNSPIYKQIILTIEKW